MKDEASRIGERSRRRRAPRGDKVGPASRIGDEIKKFKSDLNRLLDSRREADVEPAEVTRILRATVERVERLLGDTWVGETWNPEFEAHIRWHTLDPDGLEQYCDVARSALDGILMKLASSSAAAGEARVVVLLDELLQCCFDVWTRRLAYLTLQTVTQAAQGWATGWLTKMPGGGSAPQRRAIQAMSQVFDLLTADTEVFKQINLSSIEGVADAAYQAVSTASAVHDQLEQALAELSISEVSDDETTTLTGWESYCDEVAILYRSIGTATKTLEHFDGWMSAAPRRGSSQSRDDDGFAPTYISREKLRDEIGRTSESLAEAIEQLEQINKLDLFGTRSRLEPWHRVIKDLEAMLVGSDPQSLPNVFRPKRTRLRYCYPFAVDVHQARKSRHGVRSFVRELHPRLDPVPMQSEFAPDQVAGDSGEGRLTIALRQHLGTCLGFEIPSPEALRLSAFWQGAGEGLYGGVRVRLPTIVISPSDGSKAACYNAWIDLSRMNNHCLCVEPIAPEEDLTPSELYRAMRRGTPFTWGESITLKHSEFVEECQDSLFAGTREWRSLHLFSQDIIRATAAAFLCTNQHESNDDPHQEEKTPAFVRGNFHEILLFETDDPVASPDGSVPEVLNSTIGGRMVLRPVLRIASTLGEWIRYSPLSKTEGMEFDRSASTLAEVGFSGDWFVQGGEASVFGVVAAPDWLRDVFFEVPEFATAFYPALDRWNQRLQDELDHLVAERSGRASGNRSDELRELETEVRYHALQLKSDVLCQSRAQRRFLDLFLKATGVTRLEDELSGQLAALGSLADWYKNRRERHDDLRRNFLLYFIALFGIFEIVNLFLLANDQGFDWRQGHFEVWVTICLVVGVIVIGIVLSRAWDHPFRWIRSVRAWLTRQGR